jgi:hypothetical protein
MRLELHGGFGEKGRTCLAIESAGYRLMLDAGIKVSAFGRDDYYPSISDAALKATDAIVITHGHEDHVAALGWLLARGFTGRILMTQETRSETALSLSGYAPAEHLALFHRATVEPLPIGLEALRLGPFRVSTGRSGHVAGGVWCHIDDGRVAVGYCGDMVPASPVFAMDPVPSCRAIVIDASYGDDDVSAQSRAAEIGRWIAARPQGCVLPTTLYGRSAELLAIVTGPLALAPGMRDALRAQIEGRRWLVEGIAPVLGKRLDAAIDWRDGAALPPAALLCHDAMGVSGPSRGILMQDRAQGWPVLFTGHLPAGSPGERLVAENRAAWIRLPTHPTLGENLDIAATSGAATVIGHSCDRAQLTKLERRLPRLRADLATGDSVDL